MNDRRKLILQAAVALAAIIVIFSSISRIFSVNSDTLAEHAAKIQKISHTETSSTSDNINKNQDEYNIETENIADGDSSPEQLIENPSPAPTVDPQVLIMKEFYFAPLSEEQKEYITGCSYPNMTENLAISYDNLSYVHILHHDFEGNIAEGELICNNYIAQDLIEIFYELYLNEYQLEKVTLIENYDGDDERSMADNNTSCFNYRMVAGSKSLSQHAYGLAIDINPFYNPYVTYPNGKVSIAPAGSEAYADRSSDFPYKIDEKDLCYRLFKEHGFTWGGDWNSSKDYQHFQKPIK